MTDSRPTFGVRERILATVLALAAVGMGIAGLSFTVFEQQQAVDHADAVLRSNVMQFSAFADAAAKTGKVDGKPLTVDTLLEGALAAHIPTDGEDQAGLVNGKVRYISEQPRVDVDDQPKLLAAILALPPSAPSVILQIETSDVGPVRYVAVQVQVAGQADRGVYVSAISSQPLLNRLTESAWAYAGLSLVALAVIAVGGWIVAGRLLHPLGLIHTAARSISHTDLSARIPVSGRDDVSDLTRTVNAMLDRLEWAFAAQQAFLDDAGHELRTPLTIVQGHLDVVDTTNPEDVAATRALVMDELDRMARLVNDLIVLAQSGRPDFVRLEPVDLDQLLQDIHTKAPALAERNWILENTPGVIAEADAHRLTQAVLQLTDNAVRHTQVADTIGIGGALLPSGVVQLWVRDTGPGVDPADIDRIFERFGRAGPARGGSGSSGLGLSIVAGIAAAHGGSVTLDQGYPAGARFVLNLPLRLCEPSQKRADPPTRHVIASLFQPHSHQGTSQGSPRSAPHGAQEREHESPNSRR